MSQSLDLINEFEETFQVEKWAVNGLHIWPIIRIPLITAWERNIHHQKNEFPRSDVSKISTKVITEIKTYFRMLHIQYRTKLPHDERVDVGIWGFDVNRTIVGKKGYSVFGDALQDIEAETGLKTLCLDLSMRDNVRAYRSNIDITHYSLLSRLEGRIKSIYTAYELNDVDFSEVHKWCELRGLDRTVLSAEITLRAYFRINSLKKKYLKLIKKYEMKACMKVCWYDTEGMALSWAAKEAGIPCYDLQHGIAGAGLQRAYSRWSRIPKQGYKIMPDSFWCWTIDDANAIDSWGKDINPPIKTFIGGNLWQRLWVEKKYPKELFSKYLNQDKLFSEADVNILFTLQSSEIPRILLELIENSPPSWKWWVRCHPSEIDSIASTEEILKKGNVDISNATQLPLPLILNSVDAHITGWSAVVYDSLEYGLRSIVFHALAKGYFKKEIGAGTVKYIPESSNIIEALSSELSKFRFQVDSVNYPSFKDVISS